MFHCYVKSCLNYDRIKNYKRGLCHVPQLVSGPVSLAMWVSYFSVDQQRNKKQFLDIVQTKRI